MPTTAIPPVTALLVIAVLMPILFITYHAIKELIMSQQAQIDAVTEQLRKVHAEYVSISAKVDELKAANDNLQATVAELKDQQGKGQTLNLTDLIAAAQVLDDVTPDLVASVEAIAPAEPVTPDAETPVEPGAIDNTLTDTAG